MPTATTAPARRASALQLLAMLSLLCAAAALPYLSDRLPNGDKAGDEAAGLQCDALGHQMCVPGAPRNAFGLALKAAGLEWTRELCLEDSDGDGLTNGEELGDPCCVWAPGDAPLRTDNLSHPGEADSTNDAPKCPTNVTPKPTAMPSSSMAPSMMPSMTPSMMPSMSMAPSMAPSMSITPSMAPSMMPSMSMAPSMALSMEPSMTASMKPSMSMKASITPSTMPSMSMRPPMSMAPSLQPPMPMPSIVIPVSPVITPPVVASMSPTPNPGMSSEPAVDDPFAV